MRPFPCRNLHIGIGNIKATYDNLELVRRKSGISYTEKELAFYPHDCRNLLVECGWIYKGLKRERGHVPYLFEVVPLRPCPVLREIAYHIDKGCTAENEIHCPCAPEEIYTGDIVHSNRHDILSVHIKG